MHKPSYDDIINLLNTNVFKTIDYSGSRDNMEKASEIIKYADIDQLEHYIEYVEVLLDSVKKRHQKDENLESEYEILTKRFNELLE